MWVNIENKFENYPARMKVINKMIELGLRINEDGKIYCSDLKIGDKALAEAAGVDRRAIKSTINAIMDDEKLYILFKNITPAGTSLKKIAKHLELSAIEIEVESESEGILVQTADIFTKNRIDIKQACAEDTAVEHPKLTIITEGKVPPAILDEILKIKGVLRVSIY